MKTHVKALVVGGGAVGNGIAYHLAKAGWDAMHKGRRVKVVGGVNKLFAFAPRLAPRRMVAFMAGIFLKRRW